MHKNVHPRFKLCPQTCAENGFNERRIKKCETCDLKKAEDKFKEKTLELWRLALGKKAELFNFDQVLSSLYEVMSFQEIPAARMPLKISLLLNAYLLEKRVHDDTKDWKISKEAENR